MTGPEGFRLLAHTADMGIEAWAATRSGVYIQAAEGLSLLMFSKSRGRAICRQEVDLTAGDAAELLVAWLNEIVYYCDVFALVPTAFEIEQLDDQHIRGTIHGEPYDDARHAMERQVKAVTYHQLELSRRENGWYARVYVDL